MSKYEVMGICGLVGVAAAAIGYAFGQHKKLKDISDKLDRTIDEMVDGTEIDVDQAIVDAAVKKAVNNTVNPIVREEVETVTRAAVGEMRADIKKTLEERILGEITEADYQTMRSKVLDRASEKAARKMTEGLEYIFDDFRRSMRRVTSKYEG